MDMAQGVPLLFIHGVISLHSSGLYTNIEIYIYIISGHFILGCIKKNSSNILSITGLPGKTALLVGGGAISALGGFQLLNGRLFINDAVAWNSGGAQDSKPRGWKTRWLPETN